MIRCGYWVGCLVLVGGLLANGAGADDGTATKDSPTAARTSGIERENFDLSVPLGKDFFQHVNGTWLKRTEIPADKSDYGSFTALYDAAQAALRQIIEEAAKKSDKQAGSDEQKVGDFYLSFMDTERLEQLGLKPLQTLLDSVSQLQNKEELVQLFARLPRQGVSGPFVGFVNSDARKSDQYIVYLSQAGTTLPDRDYYLVDDPKNEAIRKAFRQYIVDLMTAAEYDNPERIADNVLRLETQLAEAQWTRVENRNPLKTYNKLTAEELDALMPHVDWKAFAEAAGIGSQNEFVVRQPSFLEGFDKLLDQATLEAWQDYLAFQIVDAYASVLSKKFDDLHFAFHDTTLRGVAEPSPRWKRAVEALDGVLGELVGKIYVREYFKPEAKARMNALVDNLKKAYEQRIQKLDWMSDETKQRALQKLAKINTKIGYPDEWKDYSKLEIRPDDLLGNYRRSAEFEYQRMIDKLGGPIDRNEWRMNPQTVNAYYNPLMNEIVFPAAILQPPFFNLEADDAVNYGAIGAVIGHELSHAFDDSGSRFDGDGNLNNWWTASDREEFEKRGKQLIEQYSNYNPIGELRVNGELTLGENIGDLGGVNAAYTAYQLSLDGKPAPVLDGFTGDQRFFLGYAQIWRRKYRDEELRRRLLTDPHSPARYRVIGIVSNMEPFYEAFDIQPEDDMYLPPERRVRIW